MTKLLPLLSCLAACVPEAFTPPARPFITESAFVAPGHRQDLQADAGGATFIFAPAVGVGNVRLRRALGSAVVVSGDGGVVAVAGNKAIDGMRAGTARLGVMVRSEMQHGVRGVYAGVGGGWSDVGRWVTTDFGVAMTMTDWRYVRPIVALGAYVSIPFATKMFDVPDVTDWVTRRLPTTVGVQDYVGVEFGRPDLAVSIGTMAAQLVARHTDVEQEHTQTYVGFSGGIRVAF